MNSKALFLCFFEKMSSLASLGINIKFEILTLLIISFHIPS